MLKGALSQAAPPRFSEEITTQVDSSLRFVNEGLRRDNPCGRATHDDGAFVFEYAWQDGHADRREVYLELRFKRFPMGFGAGEMKAALKAESERLEALVRDMYDLAKQELHIAVQVTHLRLSWTERR